MSVSRAVGGASAPYHHALIPSPANLFRAGVLLILAAHIFYMYSLGRTQQGTFGFDLGATIIAVLFAGAMLIPLVWAVTLPELPEIWQRHVRARRWHARGRCAACGYPVTAAQGAACPECGVPVGPPRAYQVNKRTVRLFISINLAAWLIGCAAAETWLILDEHRFRDEARAWLDRAIVSDAAARYTRPRTVPNGHATLIFRPPDRFAVQE